MPVIGSLPYLLVEALQFDFCFYIGLLKDKLILKGRYVYKLESCFCLHQASVHIAEGNVDKKGVNLLLVVHYFLCVLNIFVQTHVHFLDNILRKLLVCTKAPSHPNPIGMTCRKYCQEFQLNSIIRMPIATWICWMVSSSSR